MNRDQLDSTLLATNTIRLPKTPGEILVNVAQRLDELSDDLELPELTALSEEIGKAVALIPDPKAENAKPDRLMEEIHRLIERAAMERVGTHTFGNTFDFRQSDYARYVAMSIPTHDPAKSISSIMSGV